MDTAAPVPLSGTVLDIGALLQAAKNTAIIITGTAIEPANLLIFQSSFISGRHLDYK
jgi:hypothetical protein